MNNGNPTTLMQAVTYFSDLEVAHKFFVDARWPQGVVCPTCGSTGPSYNQKYRRFQCNHNHDRRQFTVKTGSVMEDSPISLDKWAVALWLEVNAKNSISSYEVHRALGITQKSAWFMLHRVRFALHQKSFDKPMSGIVEADETFVGGLARNMHKDRRAKTITGTGGGGKAIVMGLLERGSEKGKSKVRAQVVENTQRETLQAVIRSHVDTGSTLYTDAWQAYRHFGPEYVHEFIDHAEAYVRGAVHTNGLENFWTLFKRCIKGTHVSVEPFHLGAYVDSEAFRFSNRDVKDADRFRLAMKELHGKRLTHKALTGALEETPGSDKGEENGGMLN